MGLRDEWEAIRDAVERIAIDVTHLTTVVRCHAAGGAERASIRADVELDGDTTVQLRGDAIELRACHAAAVDFTAGLADARLRMLARAVRAILP